MKKVLIVYTSVGLGHKVVAENIAQHIRKHPNVSVELLDILTLYKGAFTGISEKIYTFIICYLPWLWGFVYKSNAVISLTLPLRMHLAGWQSQKLKDYIEKSKPDLVLTTQTSATAVMSYLKKKSHFSNPLVVTFSDFHFHPFWVYPHVDRYLVMTQEQAHEIQQRDFSKEQTVLTGLPIDAAFSKEYEAGAVLSKYGFVRTKPLVLVMGGSRGWGVRQDMVTDLVSRFENVQFGVLTGTNPKLAASLNTLAKQYPDTLQIFEALPNDSVAELFAAAHVLITKPGGLTIGQALVNKLPMILINPLPAMEEENERFLLGHGAAVSARTHEELIQTLERLLADAHWYKSIQDAQDMLKNTDAGTRAAQAVIDIMAP